MRPCENVPTFDGMFSSTSGRKKDGKPDRRFRLTGPFHAMFAVAANQDVISWLKPDFLAGIFEPKQPLAGNYQHPFVFSLIVPLVWRCRVTVRNDPFNANVSVLGEDRDKFRGQISRQILQQVSCF